LIFLAARSSKLVAPLELDRRLVPPARASLLDRHARGDVHAVWREGGDVVAAEVVARGAKRLGGFCETSTRLRFE
jgi:hypothetical protein